MTIKKEEKIDLYVRICKNSVSIIVGAIAIFVGYILSIIPNITPDLGVAPYIIIILGITVLCITIYQILSGKGKKINGES